MAYATVTHVEALNVGRGPYTASSLPNATQVAQYLAETAGELDSILRVRGYALPVATGATSALELLESYNAIGAWAKVETSAQTSDRRELAVKMWESAKKMLADSTIEIDAARSVDTSFPRYPEAPTRMIVRDNDF